MKKKFVIFNFSKGLFFDNKNNQWVGDQHIAEGFPERELAEDLIFEPKLFSLFESGDNYTILTFFYKD